MFYGVWRAQGFPSWRGLHILDSVIDTTMPAWRVMVQYFGIGGGCRDFHGVFMGFTVDGLFMLRLVRRRGGSMGRRDPA